MAKDLYVEEVTGLPQIVVNINRDEVAKYRLNVEDINNALNRILGQSAGIVYEGEKRFDLVLRLQNENRQQIEDVRNLFITAPERQPSYIVAVGRYIDFKSGPNQIQREDAKRRIIVGFNTSWKGYLPAL